MRTLAVVLLFLNIENDCLLPSRRVQKRNWYILLLSAKRNFITTRSEAIGV